MTTPVVTEQAEQQATSSTSGKPSVSAKDAQRILAREMQERIAACQKDVNAVMQRHKCVLDPRVIISRSGVQPMVAIVPQSVDDDDTGDPLR